MKIKTNIKTLAMALATVCMAGGALAYDHSVTDQVSAVGIFEDWIGNGKVSGVVLAGTDGNENGIPDHSDTCSFGVIVVDMSNSSATSTPAGQASFSLVNSALLAGKPVHIDYTDLGNGLCVAANIYYVPSSL